MNEMQDMNDSLNNLYIYYMEEKKNHEHSS